MTTRKWISGLAALLAAVFVLCAGPTPLAAQDGAAVAEDQAVKQLEDLVSTIEDEAKRQALVDQLKALIEAKRAAEEPQSSLPTDIADSVIAGISRQIEAASREMARAARGINQIPDLLAEAVKLAADPAQRQLWFRVLAGVALVLGAALGTEWLTVMLLRRVRRRLVGHAGLSPARRTLMLVFRWVIDAVPIAVFGGVALILLPIMSDPPQISLVAVTLGQAYILMRVSLISARALLAPEAPHLRIVPIKDETAFYLAIWVRRLALITVLGYSALDAGLVLGLPKAAHGVLLKFIGLAVTGMLIMLVLQNRQPVSEWIHHTRSRDRFGLAPFWRRLADVWHVLAILYILIGFGGWAAGVEDSLIVTLRGTGLTVVVLIAVRLCTLLLEKGLAKLFAVSEDLRSRYPGLEARANRYVSLLRGALKGVLYVIAALAILQAWGVATFEWLGSEYGQALIRSVATIIGVIGAAVVAWEMVNGSVERYLHPRDEDGNEIERGSRARTLLPLLRNVVFILLTLVAGLMVLSQLGLNIAPLLAGAGVVGLAVGFGAQTLVKDVITGAFILFEDSIAVGDVVDLGGMSGKVEALSIRSIRLRDYGGNVHTIPFSSVDRVTNMTKVFSYYVINMGVAYREDVDQVTQVMTEVLEEMRSDEHWAPLILEPLDIAGLDQFADSAVVIRARIKTKPIEQWGVGREYNRRLKRRFDELGIEIPFPHTTLFFGTDKQGNAPPGRVFIETEEPKVAPAPTVEASAPPTPSPEFPSASPTEAEQPPSDQEPKP